MFAVSDSIAAQSPTRRGWTFPGGGRECLDALPVGYSEGDSLAILPSGYVIRLQCREDEPGEFLDVVVAPRSHGRGNELAFFNRDNPAHRNCYFFLMRVDYLSCVSVLQYRHRGLLRAGNSLTTGSPGS